jgi:peptidoglycan hydrolase CwlO-like protein
MKLFSSTKTLLVMIIVCPVILLGCEKSTESTSIGQPANEKEHSSQENERSEKRTYLKTPPSEQERDRWEDEFLDSVPKDFDSKELQHLQEEILEGSGNIQELEEEFRKSQEEYNRNN